MYVIGLTGGIGTGKTVVAKMLLDLGADVIDADRVGHEAYRPHTETWRAVVDAFGEEILTGDSEVDRKKLGAIVFGDPAELARLNSIMHPRMYRMMEERLRELEEGGSEVAAIEAALLIEANWTSLANEVWVVTAPEDTAVARASERTGLSEEAVRSRIAAQMPQTERAAHADIVVDNGGTLEDLQREVANIWNSRVLARREQSSLG